MDIQRSTIYILHIYFINFCLLVAKWGWLTYISHSHSHPTWIQTSVQSLTINSPGSSENLFHRSVLQFWLNSSRRIILVKITANYIVLFMARIYIVLSLVHWKFFGMNVQRLSINGRNTMSMTKWNC